MGYLQGQPPAHCSQQECVHATQQHQDGGEEKERREAASRDNRGKGQEGGHGVHQAHSQQE